MINFSFGDAAVAAVDIYPPPTKCTISMRSSSFNIVLPQSLRRTTSRLSSIAMRDAGRSSCVINSAKDSALLNSFRSPLTKTLIDHKKAQKDKKHKEDLEQFRFCAFCSFVLFVYD